MPPRYLVLLSFLSSIFRISLSGTLSLYEPKVTKTDLSTLPDCQLGKFEPSQAAHSSLLLIFQGITKVHNLGGILEKKYFESKNLPYYGLNFFIRHTLLIRDPTLIKEIFIKEFTIFHDRGIYFNTERDPLTNHLFFIRGQKWRNMRIKLTPTFTTGKMKMMFPTMLQSSLEMLDYLKTPAKLEATMDVKDVFAKFTINVIARCAFGLELDSFKNPNSEFRNMSQFLLKPNCIQSFKNALFLSFSRELYNVPVNLIPPSVNDFFIGVFSDNMKYREDNKEVRKDFFQLLIELINKGFIEDPDANKHDDIGQIDPSEASRKFTIREAAAQAFNFFVAGYETASTALQFCMYELALNPKVQDKLYDEINTALSKSNGQITYDNIQEISYLDQVISETLRKYPAAPFLVREASAPYKIPNSDLVIEKGKSVAVSLLGLHNDPQYFPNPEKFDPTRFAPENKDKIVPHTYMPFGEGPRTCIGMRFAQMQMKIGLTQYLLKYRVELCEKSPTPPLAFDPKVILTALKGTMYLKIKNRQ